MKKITLKYIAVSALVAASFGANAQSNSNNSITLSQNMVDRSNIITGSVFAAPLEKFQACKNLAASVVYKMDNRVIASALDLNTVKDPVKLEAKKVALQESLARTGIANPKMVSNEFFNVMNFYLTKNNTIDVSRMNSFLTSGKINDVVITCRDTPEFTTSEYLDAGEMETTHPVLFSQKAR